MNLTLTDTLQEQRRKALLTGKPLTPQDISGMSTGYFATQARLSNQNWAQRLREEELKDQKARELEMMQAGKEQSKMTGISNMVENVTGTLGKDFLKAKPGESMIAKGADLAKAGINKVGGWFGGGAPSFTTALQAPAGEVGASMLAGAETLPAAGGAITGLEAPAGMVGDSMLAGAGETMASGVGTTVGNAVGSIIPYAGAHSLRRMGQNWLGVLSDNIAKTIGSNSKSNFFSQAARTFRNTSNIEDIPIEWGKEIGIIPDNHVTDNIMAIFNPVGALLDVVDDALGSWLCTATKNVVGLGQSEAETMKALKRYANEHHKGWLTFYLKYGTILTRIIAEQEDDVKGFYENLRRTLIEPACKVFRADPEAAFDIYHFIGKTLFRAYMPELEIKEIDDER